MSTEVKCCVCQRPREPFKVLTLTADEKRFIMRATGKLAPDTTTYCKSCWAVVSNKLQGAQLLKGMLQLKLRASGVSNAEQIATGVQNRLVKKASPKAS